MKTLHPIQVSILEKLLFNPTLKFTELKDDNDIPSNQLTFHIGVLVDEGFIEKNDQSYSLTVAGKLYANSKDSHADTEHKFQKIGVIMACSHIGKNGLEYLLYTRKKHPFFGRQGFPTGKILRGEKPEQTAAREIIEETGMTGDAKVVKLFHFINKNVYHNVIEDKYLFLCHIDSPQGELNPNQEGEFYRVTKEIRNVVQNPFDTIEDLIGMMDTVESFSGAVAFEEIVAYPEGF